MKIALFTETYLPYINGVVTQDVYKRQVCTAADNYSVRIGENRAVCRFFKRNLRYTEALFC